MWISNRYVIPSSSQSPDPGLFIVIYWIVTQTFEVYGFRGQNIHLWYKATTDHCICVSKQSKWIPIGIQWITFIGLKRSWQLQTFMLICHVICILHSSFLSFRFHFQDNANQVSAFMEGKHVNYHYWHTIGYIKNTAGVQ